MKFSLATIAYVFALLAAGMAAFGAGGLILAGGVLFYWWLVSGKSLLFSILFTACVLFFAFLLRGLPIGDARGPTVRNSCLNNLKQIGLALNNYESAHGSFPPAYLAGPDGKPMHSWRVLILPYMEHQKLYDAYDFGEPWDGPNNRKLWDRMPEVYACPSAQQARNAGIDTGDKPLRHVLSYFAVTGDSTLWPGDKGLPYSEIKDDTSDTVAVIEYSGGALPWTAPVDLTFDEAVGELTSTDPHGHWTVRSTYFTVDYHRKNRLALFADAHGKFVAYRVDESLARALFTVGGGEQFDHENLTSTGEPQSLTRLRYENVYAFMVFVGLALLPGVRLVRRARRGENSPAGC